MQKDVTLSTRISSGLRDEINKDADELSMSQAEWLRNAAESYLSASGKQADLLMLTAEDKLQIIQNHIEEIEDFNNRQDETDDDLEKVVEDFNKDLEALKDLSDKLEDDDEEGIEDINNQLDDLLDQVNDQLDDCSDEDVDEDIDEETEEETQE